MSDRLYVVSAAEFVKPCHDSSRMVARDCTAFGSYEPDDRCDGCRSDGTRTVIPEGAVEVESASVARFTGWPNLKRAARVWRAVSGTPEESR